MGFFLWLTGLGWSRREVTLSTVMGVTAPSNHRPNEQSDPKLDVANASFLIPLGKTDRHGMPSSHPLPSRTVSSPGPKPPRTLFLLLTYEFAARSAPSVSLPFPPISAAVVSDGEEKTHVSRSGYEACVRKNYEGFTASKAHGSSATFRGKLSILDPQRAELFLASTRERSRG